MKMNITLRYSSYIFHTGHSFRRGGVSNGGPSAAEALDKDGVQLAFLQSVVSVIPSFTSCLHAFLKSTV